MPKKSENAKNNSHSLSWLDEDDEEVQEAEFNSGANNRDKATSVQEVQDPMADLREAWNRGEPAKIEDSNSLSKNEQQELLDKAWNLIAQTGEQIRADEKKVLSEINERILSSLPENKIFTEEETNLINQRVANALQDEKAEQVEVAAHQDVDANLQNVALPDVEFLEERTAENDVQPEPQREEPMQQQRPALKNNPLSWLYEDDEEVQEADLNSGDNNRDKAASVQEVQDPMADLRAAWNRGEPAKRQGDEGISKEQQQELLDKAWNLIAQTGESISKENKKALSEINERILSSFPEDKVFTEEENRQIDKKVAEALKDERDEEKEVKQESQSVKPDLHDVFLPDVELDAEEQVENKDDPINLPHSKAILYDDEDVTEDKIVNPDVMANESTVSTSLQIPDFYDRLEKSLNSEAVAGNVKSEMSNIFKAAGIRDTEKLAELVDSSYLSLTDDIKNIYVSDVVFKAKMSFDAPIFLTQAYDSIRDDDLSLKDKIIAAQKIADVMLKNYSPIAFANGQLDQYADNYVLNNKDLFRDFLEDLKLPQDQIEPLMQEVENTLLYGPENKQLEQIPDQEANPNKKQEEITVEALQEVPIQQKPTEEEKKSTEKEKKPNEKESKPVNSEARVAVYTEKLKAYNDMYKLNVDANNFASTITEAWELVRNGDNQKIADGKKLMGDLFKDTLKKAFDVEKGVAYEEHRIPDFNEIIKSTNELFRSSMFAFTDLYHAKDTKEIFNATAFGGLKAGDIAQLTSGESFWKMDQTSDEAWEIQSQAAKQTADQWLKENKPYEKMIKEMNVLVESSKKGISNVKDMYDKLTAAEWLLVNNEKMMVEDPEDPLNPIPNWGNRYWKAITDARETLGIPKHTSMRELIQGNYAATAKAVVSTVYNERQIQDYVLDPDVREVYDSMDVQKEQFVIQSAHIVMNEPKDEKTTAKTDNENQIRWSISVKSEDQRMIMQNEPRVFSNLVIEKTAEVNIDFTKQDFR